MNFRSGFERTLATQLRRSKVKWEYETEKYPYVLSRTYCPDFILANGVRIEAKGVLDQETRTKMVAVKKAHPDLDIRFVFMDASKKLRKGSKTTYGEWASRNGFRWADKEIPGDWLND